MARSLRSSYKGTLTTPSTVLSSFVFMLMICTSCSFNGARSLEVEPLDLGEANIDNAELVNGDLWIRDLGDPEASDDDRLIQFDIDTDSITRHIKLSPGTRPHLLVTSDTLYTISNPTEGSIPESGGVTDSDPRLNTNPASLIRINLGTGQPVAEHPLGTLTDWGEFTGDHSFWFESDYRTIRLDLASGETTELPRIPTRYVHLIVDNQIWLFQNHYVLKAESSTGELLPTDQFLEPSDRELGLRHKTIRFYDGLPWMSGKLEDGSRQTFKFDVDSDKFVPVDGPLPVPHAYFEQDGIRWECCLEPEEPDLDELNARGEVSTALINEVPDPYAYYEMDPKAPWSKVDTETGDVLGEFRFDGYEPFAEHGGYLWLRSDENIGRVALSALENS